MILPPEFIDTVSPEALDDFLDHLILSSVGSETYEGNLEQDRQKLLHSIRRGELLVDHSEEEPASFGLITKEDAVAKGYAFDNA